MTTFTVRYTITLRIWDVWWHGAQNGCCGHRHRSKRTAERCLDNVILPRDRAGLPLWG